MLIQVTRYHLHTYLKSFMNLNDYLQQIWGDAPLTVTHLALKEPTNKQSEVSVFAEY